MGLTPILLICLAWLLIVVGWFIRGLYEADKRVMDIVNKQPESSEYTRGNGYINA